MNNKLETILLNWRFSKNIIEKYKSIGINEIFDWQAECLKLDSVLSGGNLVYSAPTSAGKTLVAELLMLKNVIQNNRKAIMIYPFVSLAREKLLHIQKILSDSHLRADGFIGSSSPNGGFNSVDIAVCTIEKANSLINRLIDDESIFDLGVIVIDELHMVNDEHRGYIIELILSKIKYLCLKYKDKSKIQLIGMSATLPNLSILSGWLNATLYQTNYRPIELNEYYKFEKSIYDKNSTLVRAIKIDDRIEKDDKELVVHLVLETIVDKFGVLVFCGNKQRCENVALSIAKTLRNLEKVNGKSSEFLNKEKLYECFCELKNTPAGLDPILHDTVRYGIGFHHAGLTIEEREILENHFKTNTLLCLVCTTTLSSGINFPARRVIIRTPVAYQNKSIDAQTYKQMAGRAGRKGIDTIGECIIMCTNQNEKKLAEVLINSKQPELGFVLKDNELKASIKRALLETIVAGIAYKKDEVIEYTNCFIKNSNESCEQYLKWLEMNKFIAIVKTKDENNSLIIECYKATQLGHAVVASAMSPDDGLTIFSELSNALKCFVLDTELHCIYQITPINICEQWTGSASKIDWNRYYSIYSNLSQDMRRVADLVGVRERFIVKMINGASISQTNQNDMKMLKVHARFYTALILNDLVNEVPFSTVLEKYDCHKGFLQSLQQQSSTYAQMIHIFCNKLGWFNLEVLIEQFQHRLMFGVQRQLIDLVRINLLNSQRARLFYNAGLTSVASIATSDMKKLEKILRSGMQFVSADSVKANEQLNNKGELVFWSDGKCYTYWEACEVIYQDANELLKRDLESMGIKVDIKKPNEPNSNNKTLIEFNDTYDSMIHSQKKLDKTLVVTEQSKDKLQDVKNLVQDQGLQEITEKNSEIEMDQITEETENICINQPQSPKEAMEIEKTLDLTKDDEILKHIQLTPRSKQSNDINEDFKTKNETNNFQLMNEINSLKDLIFETQIEKFETPDNLIITGSPTKEDEDEDLLKIPLTSITNNYKSKPTSNDLASEINSLKDLIFETQISEPVKENLPEQILNRSVNKFSNSFIDDQCILEAAETFEKVNSRKSIATNEIKNLNTTCVSQDILDICDIFEKKSVLSSRKKTSNQSLLKSKNIDKSKCKNLFGETTLNNIFSSDDVSNDELTNLNKQINLVNINLKLIQTESDFKELNDSIKPKSIISISLALQKYAIDSQEDKDPFYVYSNLSVTYKFYGALVCLDSEKQKQINFIVCKKDKIFLSFFKHLLEREDVNKILFYVKDHYKVLNELFGVKLKMPCYDLLIADWLLNQQMTTIFQIKQKYSPSLTQPIDADLRTTKSCYGCNSKFYQDYANVIRRAAIESLISINSFDKIKLQLQLQNLWIYYGKIESEIVLIASQLECDGFGFSPVEFQTQKSLLSKYKKEIEARINKISGREVNLNSTSEVAHLLYDQLKLKPNECSRNSLEKFKHHSTSKDTLLLLAKQHILPQLIILWRKINHTISNSMYPVDQAKLFDKTRNMFRIHSTINLFHVTGRMDFNDPCLQHIPKDFDVNIDELDTTVTAGEEEPIRTDEYEEGAVFFLDKIIDSEQEKKMKNCISIRSLFIPSRERVLLSADYSQLELRIITNLSKDEKLIEAFNDTKNDIFNSLASKWLNVPIEEIDDEQRQNVKKIIYGIIYGISAKTLACYLNKTESETSSFMDSFYHTFPGLKKFICAQIDSCKSKGYVETIRKRRRNFPNITNQDKKLKSQAERQAVNTVIQGSASDLVKTAMVKIEKTLRKKFSQSEESARGAFLVLQLHDELIYEVNKSDLDEVKEIIKDCMENCIDFPVRMKIKMRIGESWGNLEKV